MEKFKMECGLIAYRASATETYEFGGAGICDECGEFAPHGFLVPVLNHYQCESCFQEFNARAIAYPEDAEIEKRYASWFEQNNPIAPEITDWSDHRHLFELMDNAEFYDSFYPGKTENGSDGLIMIRPNSIIQFYADGGKVHTQIIFRDGSTVDGGKP